MGSSLSRLALARALEERARRSRAIAFAAALLCFGPQLRAVDSTSKRKVLRCGRRAGKTYAIVVAALLAARRGWTVLYVTLTRGNAKEIAWSDLLALNDQFGLGGEVNLTDLTMRFPSGGVIQLRGANNERETAKIRGKKFHLVFVDEAQSIPDRILKPLITEVLRPTLIDYDGELWLVGTPPPVRAGFFWECYSGRFKDRWEQHHWNLRENERLPSRVAGRSIEDILREIREEMGWEEDDPTYQREILGADVEDIESLLYQFDAGTPDLPGRNIYDELPKGEWQYVFGVDLGFDDSDAIAVLGWVKHSRRLYLVEEYVQDKEDITDLAEALRPMIERYKPLRVVIDEGGGGKKAVAELRRRKGLSLEAAEKTQKAAYIRLLNADLRKGLLVARRASRYAEDCKLVQKDPKALLRGVLQEKPKGEGGFHSDVCDAVLYGWRAALHFFEEPATEKPKEQAEARATEAAQLVERLRDQAERDRHRDPVAAALGFDDT